MRIAVLGDASGWLSPTLAAVRSLGVQVDLDRFSWPDDLVVVHVGDLVHKGPDGDDLVAWVDAVMDRVGDRWIQLLGNHEASYLGGPMFGTAYGSWDLRPETVTTLRRWFAEARGRLAVAVQDTGGEEWLVTHAGLTAGTWESLRRPATASAISGALNSVLTLNAARAFRPGKMLDHNKEPGVVWASEAELCDSWEVAVMPCSQIRGHTNPYDFSRRAWRSALPPAVCRAATTAMTSTDEEARHLRLPLGGRTVLCVDPGFGARRPRHRLTPHVLDGQILGDQDTLLADNAGGPSDGGDMSIAAADDIWPCQFDAVMVGHGTVSFGPVSWERLEALLGCPAHVDLAAQAAHESTSVEPAIGHTEADAWSAERPARPRGFSRWRRRS